MAHRRTSTAVSNTVVEVLAAWVYYHHQRPLTPPNWHSEHLCPACMLYLVGDLRIAMLCYAMRLHRATPASHVLLHDRRGADPLRSVQAGWRHGRRRYRGGSWMFSRHREGFVLALRHHGKRVRSVNRGVCAWRARLRHVLVSRQARLWSG